MTLHLPAWNLLRAFPLFAALLALSTPRAAHALQVEIVAKYSGDRDPWRTWGLEASVRSGLSATRYSIDAATGSITVIGTWSPSIRTLLDEVLAVNGFELDSVDETVRGRAILHDGTVTLACREDTVRVAPETDPALLSDLRGHEDLVGRVTGELRRTGDRIEMVASHAGDWRAESREEIAQTGPPPSTRQRRVGSVQRRSGGPSATPGSPVRSGAPGPSSVLSWRDGAREARQALAASGGRPVVLYFHASWCGACDRFDANVLSDTDVIARLRRDMRLVSIDIDDGGDVEALLDEYGVRGIPAFIVRPNSWAPPVRLPTGSPSQLLGSLDSVLR